MFQRAFFHETQPKLLLSWLCCHVISFHGCQKLLFLLQNSMVPLMASRAKRWHSGIEGASSSYRRGKKGWHLPDIQAGEQHWRIMAFHVEDRRALF